MNSSGILTSSIRRQLSKEISKIVKATTRIDASNAEILFAMERMHQLLGEHVCPQTAQEQSK